MRVWRFRRLGAEYGEIAFSEAHMHAKLNGEMAEVIAPAESWAVRLWRRFFPLRGVEGKVLPFIQVNAPMPPVKPPRILKIVR